MPEPDLLVGDAEREQAVARLRDACADGQLTLSEFSERVETALTARTQADLVPVTADLSVTLHAASPPRRTAVHRLMAVMGSTKQRGRWRAGEHLAAVAVMGECRLDLRQAVVESLEVEITATAIMGNVTITVPPGVDVEMDGWAVMGSREHQAEPALVDRVRRALLATPSPASEQPSQVPAPLLRIHTRVLMGEVKVEYGVVPPAA